MNVRDQIADALRRKQAEQIGAHDLTHFRSLCPAERARWQEQADAALLVVGSYLTDGVQSYAAPDSRLAELITTINSMDPREVIATLVDAP